MNIDFHSGCRITTDVALVDISTGWDSWLQTHRLYLNGVSYPFIRMENIQLLFIVGYVESSDSRSNATEEKI